MIDLILGWLERLLLWLLEKVSGSEWLPVKNDPDPGDWPDWIEQKFGDWEYLKQFTSQYAPSDEIGFWKVLPLKAGVFEPASSAVVIRPDGTDAYKYVFSMHVKEGGAFLNVKQNAIVLGFRKLIPTTTAVMSKAYSDGEQTAEICIPGGCVLRRRHVTLIGWLDANGRYHSSL